MWRTSMLSWYVYILVVINKAWASRGTRSIDACFFWIESVLHTSTSFSIDSILVIMRGTSNAPQRMHDRNILVKTAGPLEPGRQQALIDLPTSFYDAIHQQTAMWLRRQSANTDALVPDTFKCTTRKWDASSPVQTDHFTAWNSDQGAMITTAEAPQKPTERRSPHHAYAHYHGAAEQQGHLFKLITS